ncbi:MAG: TolB family protein [Solirubrobacterales bacterium]
MSARAAIAAAASGLLLLLLLASPAAAEPGPIQIVSTSATDQAASATTPALSGDGRYIAFSGSIGGRAGVFRKDLETGALIGVATGNAYEEGGEEPDRAEARAPSISADGRYVSFTTPAPLDPLDDPTPGTEDVYVADLATSPPTYELASALSGSSQRLGGEASASPGVALSADGREVAFVDEGQVYLRNLSTRQTTLVSVRRDPETGAIEPGVPVPEGGVVDLSGQPLLYGAALSADGTTVAWMGAHLPEQVPLLADERLAIEEADAGAQPYVEPLWRRVADGAEAPTRRIVGGGDPLAPGCPPAGTLAEPVCQGPFPDILHKDLTFDATSGWLGVAGVDGAPHLSADGRTVALIGNPTEATNVFLVDMAPGLSRRQATRQLTQQIVVNPTEQAKSVNVEPFVPLNGHIFDLAISPNGDRIAFATARQRFPLAPPYLVTQPPSALGLVELYLLDLEGETITRLTHGDGGLEEASLGGRNQTAVGGAGADSPSLSEDGELIAFASTASNLVGGDGNDAGDVFTVADPRSSRIPGAATISPPPAATKAKPGKRMRLSAFSLPNGNVRLVAVVPAAGGLRASAGAALATGKHYRRLSSARGRSAAGGPVSLLLKLPARYRRLARRAEGLYASARVSFRRRGAKPQRAEVQVHFRVHKKKKKKGGR